MANGLPTTVTTPKFRVSYPSLFTPQLNKLSGKKEYSVQALFPEGTDLSELKRMAENACINKWGADKSKWPTEVAKAEIVKKYGPDASKWEKMPPVLRSPFKSQAELIEAASKKEKDAGHLSPKGVFMTFKAMAVNKKTGKDNPAPVIVGKNPKEVITEESKFYGGCWAKANVNASAYENGGNFGVSFYINAVQFVGDGEPFGGKPNPEAAFEAIPEDDVKSSAEDMFS